jgi:hypothetical protein
MFEGPEKELLQLAVFRELHALFPGVCINIELVGPAVPKSRLATQAGFVFPYVWKGSPGAAVKLLPCDHEVMSSSPENNLLQKCS